MDTHLLYCKDSSCIVCMLKEPNLERRQSLLCHYFKQLPANANAGHASAVSGIWTLAMSQPNNTELIDAGVLGCMASLVWKGIQDRRWLLQQQNVFVPYYTAHIIGSYTMNREDSAERAVKEGVIPPLIELLRGRLTWVEQRVAVRALGHLASFTSTFLSVAMHCEILQLTMELALCSLEIVYTHFIQFEDKRLRYHRDLLTRRAHRWSRGRAMEDRKAEQWASQLQCWSLQLINCFAFKEKYIPTICRPSFLTKLPDMWGGLMNEESPAGIGLLRTICQHKAGRSAIATCPTVVQALCRVARSSDDWQYVAVECLLLLLQDTQTRQQVHHQIVFPLWSWSLQVMNVAVMAMVDLAELPIISSCSQRRLGDDIVETLLQDDTQSPSAYLRGCLSKKCRRALDELASLGERARWEKLLSKHELLAKEHKSLNLKLEGNTSFAAGDVRVASFKYTEALALCPTKAKKERMVLFSNRSQCHLMLQDAEAAISDATRAMCLARPVNSHGKSLWRRAQAYEMLGMAKESLMDAIIFANECTHLAEKRTGLLNQPAVPDYVVDMVNQQMKEAWLFKEPAMKHGCISFQSNAIEKPEAENPASPVSSSLPSTATRATMAPAKWGAQTRGERAELDTSGSSSWWGSSSEDNSMATARTMEARKAETTSAAIKTKLHNFQQDRAGKPESQHGQQGQYAKQSKFTPRSRDFLHSLHGQAAAESGLVPTHGGVSPKRAPSPLLPSVREEIDKHLQKAGRGQPLDTQLLKKTVYDLLHQNFWLERSQATTSAPAEDHFPVRDDTSYIAR